MISKKKVHFSIIFSFAVLLILTKLSFAAPGELVDNNLYAKAPFWYPCHDWKFTWFIPCSYTPVVNLTLSFVPPVLPSYSLPPVVFGARVLSSARELLLSLPSSLIARIVSGGESFTPVIYPSVTFIPSSGLGGPGGFLGSPESYGGDPGAGSPGSFPPGSPSGAPPAGPDLTVDLPPIDFDPVVDPPAGPIDLVLPIPDPVLPVPIPPVLGSPSGPTTGSDEPLPSPGVTPPSFVPTFTPPASTPPGSSVPPPPASPSAPVPPSSPTLPTSPSVVPPGGDTFGDFIDGIGDLFGDIFGGGGDWDFGDAPDGDIAYPDTAEGGGAAGATSCTSFVDSYGGPYKTTATAICGFTCVSGTPTIDFYIGEGTPFIGSAPPSYAPPDYSCNGKPTLGKSSIGCSCK